MTAAGLIHHPVYATMSFKVPTDDKTLKVLALHMLIEMSLSSTTLTVFLTFFSKM